MIVMSFMQVSVSKYDGIDVQYRAAFQSTHGNGRVPASVDVELNSNGGRAWLNLSLEDARTLADRLPQILMLHDAAERLAAEMAVDRDETAPVPVGKAQRKRLAEQSGQAAA
ncbi:hypothetical protein [Nocardia sp. CA-120079]|uniref:hypothetical protein n=1 Tax=Nocardia sp. CA-120079 TaxID=3239974 RepID=UPI003D99E5E9